MSEVERVRAVYDGYRDGRSARWVHDRGIRAERREILTRLVERLGRPEQLQVLDLGCGRGERLPELSAAGIPETNVIGVDLLVDRLAQAHIRGMRTAVATGTALPFAERSFDLVVVFTVLSSIPDDRIRSQLASEVRRVLRPDGAVLVYDMRVPSPGNPNVRPLTSRQLGSLFPGWSGPARSCTVLPPVARRLVPDPGLRYRVLATVPLLRSHRMSLLRPSGTGLGIGPLEEPPTVSVVMPVRNEAGVIERSLGAVLDQQGVTPPQVIVVDGRSDDDTVARVNVLASARGKRVTVLDNPDRIVPVAMNLGLREATGEVIVRVDGHCVIAPDYLRRCIDALRSSGAECVGGPMETVGEVSTAASIAAAQSSRFGVGGAAFRTSTRAAFVDTVAFGAYRREVFQRIGGFDPELVRNQDDELNLRLTRAGGRIWMDPRIRSTYFGRATLPSLWRQYWGYGFYKVAVMRKHRTVPALRHLVPAGFVAGTTASLTLSLRRRSLWPAAGLLVPYGLAVTGSSFVVASRVARARPATVAAATAIMHVAYGVGWWSGAVHTARWRRSGSTVGAPGRRPTV